MMQVSVIFLLLLTLSTTASLTVGILGAQGNLGREVVTQCLACGWTVNAYVRRPVEPILTPVRRGWLSPNGYAVRAARPITSDHLHIFDSSEIQGTENALVSVMSGEPFGNEFKSVDAFCNACSCIDAQTCCVCLVSAHGVGDSINGANVGIQIMRNWYLKGTYAAKKSQEDYLHTSWNGTYTILRPLVLSYDSITMNPGAQTRASLANEICTWIGGVDRIGGV